MKVSRHGKPSGSSARSDAASAAPVRQHRTQVASIPGGNARVESPRSTVAKNIQMARTVFSWSQEGLGTRCNLNRTHISALERESLSVGIDTLDRIADAFGVAAYVLLMPPPDAQRFFYQSFMESPARPGLPTARR